MELLDQISSVHTCARNMVGTRATITLGTHANVKDCGLAIARRKNEVKNNWA